MYVPNYDPSVQGVIYALHTGDNVIRYIGLTSQDPVKYLMDHKRKAKASKIDPVSGYRRPLYTWMRKHGIENIQMTVLDTPLLTELNEVEIEYIIEYRSLGFELVNSADGGSGRRGEHITEETRKRISEAKKGKPRPDMVGNAYTFPVGSVPHNKGVSPSEEVKAKISAKLKGRSLSEETRRKMSESRKGKPQPNNPSAHNRHHRDKNVVNDTCKFCLAHVLN